eukprot:scaffold32563_cov60-Cyclotella_meneghiniana.AAC.1
MYGIRKPFKAATFEDENGEKIMFGTQMTLKTALILTQLVGYLSSKFIGIKVTSESKGRQDYILVALCLFSEASLILFGILGTYATDWCFIAMFLNGLPLGMVWGLVVSYFEGRAGADFMMVALCISFIVGSGVVKDVALALLDAGYSQFWVPAIEGAMFAVLWLICIVGLNQLPPPSEVDKSERGERISMDHSMRLEYYLTFWPGLLALWLGAMCLTAYRDSFAVEIIEDMGVEVVPGTLLQTESIIAGCLMIPIASLVFIKDNVKSFGISLFFLVAGAIILLVSTTAYMASPYDGINYYMVTGLGSYLGYVPYNSVLYERLIGSLRKPCTVSYLMSVMDALGYLGVFVIFLVAEFVPSFNDYLDVYNTLGQVFGWLMLGLYVFSAFYFFVKLRTVLFGSVENLDSKELAVTEKTEVTAEMTQSAGGQKVSILSA